MVDPRVEQLSALVDRIGGAARWLARLATRAALPAGAAALVLWWMGTGERVDEWWRGTAVSVLVLVVCLAPAAWLVNVRVALLELVELPDKLGEVVTRRAEQVRTGAPLVRPDGGVFGAVRAMRGVVSDYGDLMGSWAVVAQLVAPSFWFLTVVALAAVPVLVVLAAVVALVDFYG